MGIRFRCHHCEFELHVKDYQGGKKGKCPKCKGRFKVPLSDADYSLEPEVDENMATSAQGAASQAVAASALASHHDSSQSVQTRDFPESKSLEPQQSDLPRQEGVESESLQTSGDPAQPQNLQEQPTPAPVASESAPPTNGVDSVLQDPNAQWYVRPPSGGQFGPAATAIFVQWLGENRVTADSLIWRDGWQDWRVASEVLTHQFANSAPAALDQNAPTHATQPSSQVGQQPTQVDPQPVQSAPVSNQVAPNAAAPAQVQMAPATGAMPAANQQFSSPQPAGVSTQLGGIGGSESNSASISERNRIQRKQRRKRNYMIMMVMLSVLTIVLVVALVIILMTQS